MGVELNGMNHAVYDLFRNVCVQPGVNYVYYYYEGYYVYFYYCYEGHYV